MQGCGFGGAQGMKHLIIQQIVAAAILLFYAGAAYALASLLPGVAFGEWLGIIALGAIAMIEARSIMSDWRKR